MKTQKRRHLFLQHWAWPDDPKSAGLPFTINLSVVNVIESFHYELSNAVFNNHEGLSSKALLNVCLPQEILSALELRYISLAESQWLDV